MYGDTSSAAFYGEQKLHETKSQFIYSEQCVMYNEQPFRIEGDELKEVLHRSVGALTFINGHKRVNAGSGVLISKDTLLTSAHSIFDKGIQTENTNFKFYLGADGIAEDYHEIESWRYPQEFRTCPQAAKLAFDYALLKLKRPVNFDKFLPLSLACKQDLLKNNESIMLKIYGFPCSYQRDQFGYTLPFNQNFMPLDQKGRTIRLYQYGLTRKNRIVMVDHLQSKIGYGITTLPGQAGCPVVMDNEIIAVHVGSHQQQFNIGRIVDASFISNLRKWEKELSSSPFSLKDRNNEIF